MLKLKIFLRTLSTSLYLPPLYKPDSSSLLCSCKEQYFKPGLWPLSIPMIVFTAQLYIYLLYVGNSAFRERKLKLKTVHPKLYCTCETPWDVVQMKILTEMERWNMRLYMSNMFNWLPYDALLMVHSSHQIIRTLLPNHNLYWLMDIKWDRWEE